MIRLISSGISRHPRSRRQTGILLLLFCASLLLVSRSQAQEALTIGGQSASNSAPTNDDLDSSQGAAPRTPSAGFHPPPPDSEGFRRSAKRPENDSVSSATRWDRFFQDLYLDAYQMGVRSGNLAGASNGSFSGSGAAMQSGAGFGGSPNRSGAASFDLNSIFQMASGLSRDLGEGKQGAAGTALGILPAVNRLTHQGVNLPGNSSLGSFHLSYQIPFLGLGGSSGRGMEGGMGNRGGYGSPSASFTSSHVRTGKIDFSTTATISDGLTSSSSGMSAGLSSFSVGSSSFGGQASGAGSTGGAMGGQASGSMGGGQGGGGRGGPGGGSGGGPGGGSGGPGGGSGSGGDKHPTASVSFRLSF